MQIEYEATFTGIDKDDIRHRLKKVGAQLVRPEFLQRRVNFVLPQESPYYSTGWLRVRDEGDKITMSMKAVTDNVSIEGQKEVCLSVDSFEQAKQFLVSLGCKEKAYQESKRELWMLDGVEICIDEWPWLELFVEVEGRSEEDVKRVSSVLGFDYTGALFDSVDEQYSKKYKVTKFHINNETPRFVFGESCPFE